MKVYFQDHQDRKFKILGEKVELTNKRLPKTLSFPSKPKVISVISIKKPVGKALFTTQIRAK